MCLNELSYETDFLFADIWITENKSRLLPEYNAYLFTFNSNFDVLPRNSFE